MSNRHRDDHAEHAPKAVRAQENRKLRRSVEHTLQTAVDPDEIVIAQPKPYRQKAGTVGTHGDGRVRHWKLPFWKRRTANRVARAQAARGVADVEDTDL